MGSSILCQPLKGLYGSSILGPALWKRSLWEQHPVPAPWRSPYGSSILGQPLDTSSLAPVAPEQTENSNFTHGKAALAMALQMAL